MKPEINNENKAKFFALYWGQEVAENPLGPLIVNGICLDYVRTDSMECALNLKPLSSISDEEISYVKSITRYKYDVDVYSMVVSLLGIPLPRNRNIEHWRAALILDYLRSKGYALPYLGLTVEEMVEAGWIKLIEQ